mgnify:CR=1 FL=1
MDRHIEAPITKKISRTLRAGDYVYITGTIYTARDAAHKRMEEALEKGEPLPVGIEDQTIYYMGPSPAREGRPIGSAGPTTASRMDKYTPRLLDMGLSAMIGKGKRSPQVLEAIVRNGSVYLAAVGGAAFYFLVLKPKQGKKVPSDLDDFDLEDEEEYLTEDEETEDTK